MTFLQIYLLQVQIAHHIYVWKVQFLYEKIQIKQLLIKSV